MKKKILITGTAGFIFSNFIRKAIYEKYPYDFVSIDKISYSNSINDVYQHKSHKFYIGDITDIHFIDTIFNYEKPNIIIHGAAESHVDISLQNPNKFISSNVMGTQILINASIKYNIDKFLYCSTDEVLGQLTSENDKSWDENSIPNPRNPYSASKYAGELMVKAAHESFGLNYLITRSSNNYGPRQTSDKFIPKIIKSILNNEKIPVYGKGEQIRDWMYVADNCNGILKVLEDGKLNNIYHIGAHQEFSNIEVAQMICNQMGRGHELISFIEDPRKSHDFRYSVNTSKIESLGWSPQYKFKDGIKDTIDWYCRNAYFLR